MNDPGRLSSFRGNMWVGRRKTLAVFGLITILVGVVYYGWFRSFDSVVADPTLGTFPSLVHMLGLTWLALAIAGIRRGIQIAAMLLIISLVAEVYLNLFDPLDVVMLIIGFCMGGLSAAYYLRHVSAQVFSNDISLVSAGLVLSTSFLIVGSGCYPLGCTDSYRGPSPDYSDTPVYMDYQTLRTSVVVSDPRPVSDISRVYVYQSTVFLNMKNQGIHVLDNTDPSNPRNVAFIEIPGNTELSIRDGFLYADSYIDLVTININDPQNVQEVNRQLDVFPYDEYQNIPDGVYFNQSIDRSRGVVVSYESN